MTIDKIGPHEPGVHYDNLWDPDYGAYELARRYAKSQGCDERRADEFAAFYLAERELDPPLSILPRRPLPF